MIKMQVRKEMQMMHKQQQEEIDRQKEYIREIRPGIPNLLDLFVNEKSEMQLATY